MRLYVNVDHVATVREARGTDEPDPLRAAVLAELGGADGITVHLREDRRHIQDRDVTALLGSLRTVLNLEVAAEKDVVGIACDLKPVQVTLVPERREEITTEGGLNLQKAAVRKAVGRAVARLQDAGIRVSLFVVPDEAAIQEARKLGVEAVELHTGEYANGSGDVERARELQRLHQAVRLGKDAGLAVHAGHGLTYENVLPVAALPGIEELNIGHAIVSRAVLVGMVRAVQDMKELINQAPARVPEPGRWVPPVGH